jgi:hypothetical protein
MDDTTARSAPGSVTEASALLDGETSRRDLSLRAALEPAPVNGRRTSELLREFLETQTGPRISLGSLRDALGDRGFGVLIFMFALPNLVPVSVPMLSAVLGLPLVLLAAQLSYGRHEPWLPDWLTSWSFPREVFTAMVLRALPSLERIEKLLRPRLTGLLSWTGERLIGVALLILAVVLTLPIPFGNWLPAFAIAIIGLAVAEKDGVAVLVGIATGIVSLFIAGAVVIGLIKAALLILSGLFG